MTMLTKISFLNEVSKQYVMTAKAKGLTDRRVLYGHMFRNAKLIVIAGFLGALVGILFTSTLLIEVIFSLLGLPLLMAFSRISLMPVVRAEFLHTRNFDYVRAARTLGQTDLVIMVRHVLPNAMVATLTFLPFVLNGSIVTLTTLDFLGFGLPLGSPSLGELLAQGKSNIQAPWPLC